MGTNTDSALRFELLVVDDDDIDREVVARHLRQMKGVDVDLVEVATADEAMAALAERAFDAYLVDYQIGGTCGRELLVRMRAAGFASPVIFVTGRSDVDVVTEVLNRGAADYLSKDVLGPAVLQRSLTNAVEKHRLRLEIERRNAELSTQNVKLEAKNREIESFYHSLAHELKTPLTSMREFISIVLDELQGPVTDDQRESLVSVRQSCDYLAGCIHDLLDATRLETGKMAIAPRDESIRDVVETSMRTLVPQAREKGIVLRESVADACDTGFFDRQRIQQVLVNLLGNAVKFTPAGGTVELRVEPCREGDWVEFRVADEGRGIPEDEKERIFDRLYQSSEEDAAVQGGLGLGLNITRELVELHGGSIELESRVGEGTTFSFTVPCHSLFGASTNPHDVPCPSPS